MTDEEPMSALFPKNMTSLMDFVAMMDKNICGLLQMAALQPCGSEILIDGRICLGCFALIEIYKILVVLPYTHSSLFSEILKNRIRRNGQSRKVSFQVCQTPS
jgi:hypothetical protein